MFANSERDPANEPDVRSGEQLRYHRLTVSSGSWLTSGARVAILLYAVVAVAVLGLAQRALMGARVPRALVMGRAAAALGDSGVFASPVIPPNVRPAVPHADAESAAVAMGYWDVPSYQDFTSVPAYKDRPLERRHFCGRSYYVRSVVMMPDTNVVQSHVGNDWGMWAPTWVVPICDDVGRVRTSVHFLDVPSGLRVVLGDQPGDVPELVHPTRTLPHIGFWSSRDFRNWERGISMTPETAVAVAAALLKGTGARVAEVPEAFTIIVPPGILPQTAHLAPSTFAWTPLCARWRVTLDRPVTLRGAKTGQSIRTRTVYVVRGESGCYGVPELQVPKPAQPTTVPFMYTVGPVIPDSGLRPVNGRSVQLPPPEFRWTTLRVLEPIWFEPARLVGGHN